MCFEQTEKINVSTKVYNKRATIPEDVRNKLKISNGDSINWVEDMIGRVYVEKVEKIKVPFNESF